MRTISWVAGTKFMPPLKFEIEKLGDEYWITDTIVRMGPFKTWAGARVVLCHSH